MNEPVDLVGVVLVAHGRLALEMKDAAESIVGPIDRCAAVEVPPNLPLSGIRERVEAAIRSVDGDRGTLVLTDLFGGSPTNMCLSFLEEGKVDVLSGVTLPMLMKLSTSRRGKSLAQLSRLLRDYGRRHIVCASEVLAGRERSGGTGAASR